MKGHKPGTDFTMRCWDTAKFNYTGFTVYCQVLLDTILRDHLQSRSNLVYTHSIDKLEFITLAISQAKMVI